MNSTAGLAWCRTVVARPGFERRALTVPNWIHDLLHHLLLLSSILLCSSAKQTISDLLRDWIKFDVWSHRCSFAVPLPGQIHSVEFGTAEARRLDQAEFQPRSDRGIDSKQSYSIFQKPACLVQLDHVNKTSSCHLLHFINSFSIKIKIETHAKIFFKRPVSLRIFAD